MLVNRVQRREVKKSVYDEKRMERLESGREVQDSCEDRWGEVMVGSQVEKMQSPSPLGL